MKIARVFVLLIASLSFASSVLAQMRTPEPRVTSVMERYVYPVGIPRPTPHTTTMHAAGLDFTVARDTDWQDLSDGLQHTFFFSVRNLTSSPLPINIIRTQLLSTGWASSICDPNLCHAASDGSIPWTLQPNASANFSLNLIPMLDDEPDSGTVWLRIAGGTASDTMSLPFYGTYLPSDTPIVFQWGGIPSFAQTFQGSGTWPLKDFLENHAARGIDYLLTIQDSLPTGWHLTFDDQENPNSTTGNTGDTIINLLAPVGTASLVTNFSGYGDSTYQQRLTFTLNAPTVTKEDSAVIYLSIHPQTSNPADSANKRFVMVVQPQSSVAGAPDDRVGLAVTNAWPNPLVGGGVLHLEVLTDQAGQATALIYDVTGTQKGTLDLGMLHEGTNELQAAAPSLPSGEYIIRVNQGSSASEVVRINYVK